MLFCTAMLAVPRTRTVTYGTNIMLALLVLFSMTHGFDNDRFVFNSEIIILEI